MSDNTLFDIDPVQVRPKPELENLSAGQRRVRRQLAIMRAGYHPLAPTVKLHDDAAPVEDKSAPGRRCGNCRFRLVLPYRNHSFPKCLNPGSRGADEVDLIGYPYVTHGAASDCRSWWPACRDHSYGDPRLSDDAARYVPEAVA